MTKPWYRANPALYDKVREEVESTYPDLKFFEESGAVVIRGRYPLFEEDQVWSTYLVEVILDRDAVGGLPIVREVGGRIPRITDRHINESDGTACVVLPEAFWFEYPDGLRPLAFLNGPLRGFLASQHLIDQGVEDPWPDGEWDHGGRGVVDFYKRKLDVQETEVIDRFLDLLSGKKVKGHWLCPCGSGKRLRNCHRPIIEKLRKRVPRKVFVYSRNQVQQELAAVIKARVPVKP